MEKNESPVSPDMKVRYIGKDKGYLIKGKVYDVLAFNYVGNEYRIVDESGEDYLFPDKWFEVVQGSADITDQASAEQVPPAG